VTREEHASAVQALIDQIAPIVSEASRTVPHTVILSALLGMFRTTALHTHPACTEVAAQASMSLGLELTAFHAQQQAPYGAPMH
jgi:hypothetical protein